ncbi:MAG: metal-dependent hydrolase [Deltaproteobacteria bacterium]|nr:metal-dependent hydrolase [Deltaproteobacteria bacterium]
MTQLDRGRITVRAPRFDHADAPEAWLDDDPGASRVVDALSLIFPEGERFFIRSVKHYASVFENDPELAARVRGFIGQEGRHGHEHDRWNKLLAARGYPVEAFLARYRELAYERIESATPAHLRLATTVALEHMTSTLAVVALTTPVLDGAHPSARTLLSWHAVEEIEHRAVAFDVLSKVDPRLRTRALGFAIGTAMLGVFWSQAFAMLTAHANDGRTQPRRRFARHVRATLPFLGQSVLEYFRRDFHPEDHDLSELVAEGLRRAGIAPRPSELEGSPHEPVDDRADDRTRGDVLDRAVG